MCVDLFLSHRHHVEGVSHRVEAEDLGKTLEARPGINGCNLRLFVETFYTCPKGEETGAEGYIHPPSNIATLVCRVYGRNCASRIGMLSHTLLTEVEIRRNDGSLHSHIETLKGKVLNSRVVTAYRMSKRRQR